MRRTMALIGALLLASRMALSGEPQPSPASGSVVATPVAAPSPASPVVAPAPVLAAPAPAPVQTAQQQAPSSWRDVGWQALGIVLSVLGTAAGVLVVALLKRWLGKMGLELSQAQEDLITTLVKKGVNHAQYQAQQALAKDATRPMGEANKLAVAVDHVLELAVEHGMVDLARERVEKLVQAQLGHDRSTGASG